MVNVNIWTDSDKFYQGDFALLLHVLVNKSTFVYE